MPYMNEHMVMGHVGQEPDVKYTPSGKAVANLSVATTEKWKDKDGNPKEKTSWHRVVIWGSGAEFVNEYVKKGDLVLVKAPSYTREWEDKDGVKRYTTEITCTRYEHFKLLKSKEGASTDKPAKPVSAQEEFDDDIPF